MCCRVAAWQDTQTIQIATGINKMHGLTEMIKASAQASKREYLERLRDEFAMATLPTMLSLDLSLVEKKNLKPGEKVGEYIARKCYEYADYMIAERNK